MYSFHFVFRYVRDISLTMGAGGLLNRWGGGSLNFETLFWGDHSILGPIYGGESTNHHHVEIIK